MIEIEKYAQAAASTARTPPNSPARRAALEVENAARVAAEQFVKGLEAERDELRARLAVRLQIDAAFGHHITHKVYASRSTAFPSCPVSAAHDGTEPDKMRAWREAVTLCAAAVGERMRGER